MRAGVASGSVYSSFQIVCELLALHHGMEQDRVIKAGRLRLMAA